MPTIACTNCGADLEITRDTYSLPGACYDVANAVYRDGRDRCQCGELVPDEGELADAWWRQDFVERQP